MAFDSSCLSSFVGELELRSIYRAFLRFLAAKEVGERLFGSPLSKRDALLNGGFAV